MINFSVIFTNYFIQRLILIDKNALVFHMLPKNVFQDA